MAGAGLELSPGAAADTFAERCLVYTALTRASHYLWVSYPLADEEGKGLSPSLLIKRLKELSGITKLKLLPVEPVLGTEREYLAHPKRSLSALAAGLRVYKSHQEMSPVWWDVYNWAQQKPVLTPNLRKAVAGLFHCNKADKLPNMLAGSLYAKSNRLRGSVTRFESFRACPFKHFAGYGLGLRERAVFRLQAPDLGQFYHAALKEFGDIMQSKGQKWGSVSTAEYTAICRGIVAELAPKLQNEILLSSEQYKHMVGRLEATVVRSVQRLVEYDQVSQFKPLVTEQAFGRGIDALPPLVYQLVDGITLEIAGQIDRLDVVEHNGHKYMLVIDYKSGGAWLKLLEVYHGLKLQLLTYLLVAQTFATELVGGADCQAAGVLYCFLKNPSLSSAVKLSEEEINKKINGLLKMPGWTLAEADIVRLLDNSLEGRSEFLKIGLKKDDTFYANCLHYVKTADEFTLLIQHVRQLLVATGNEILAGVVDIRPYRLDKAVPCSYCIYSPVCQFDQLLPENEYHKLPRPADVSIMAELAAKKEDKP